MTKRSVVILSEFLVTCNMVFTQSQVQDVKLVVDQSIKTVLGEKHFLDAIAAGVIKIVEEKLQKTFAEIDKRISECDIKISEVTQQNMKLSQELDKQQQYSRRNNLRIFGLPVVPSEDTEEVVLNLFKSNMQLNLEKNMLDRVHRLGKVRDNKQQIIVKFISYRYRSLVLKNRKNLKGSGIYIAEDLTTNRIKLYKEAQTKYGKEHVWTNDGAIWVRKGTKKEIFEGKMQESQ